MVEMMDRAGNGRVYIVGLKDGGNRLAIAKLLVHSSICRLLFVPPVDGLAIDDRKEDDNPTDG